MQNRSQIEDEVRKLAMSLPPSDFGSHRAIQAVTTYVLEKMAQQAGLNGSFTATSLDSLGENFSITTRGQS